MQKNSNRHSFYSAMSGLYPSGQLLQTVVNLVVGTEYDLSVDFKVLINNIAITESCYVYLYHDSLTTPNIVRTDVASYNRNSDNWKTLAGKYIATSSNMMFGVYVTCSPYRIPQVSIIFDNAVIRGRCHLICVFSLSLQHITVVDKISVRDWRREESID